MLYREIIAVCSQIHTKHINTLCGQNVELLNVKLVVCKVTTGFIGLMFYFPLNSSRVTIYCYWSIQYLDVLNQGNSSFLAKQDELNTERI
jgi:hypothetical protein